MTTVPLDPSEEAKLDANAQARGMSEAKASTRSLRGLLAKYGPAPSAEEIDQNRAEMFVNFALGD